MIARSAVPAAVSSATSAVVFMSALAREPRRAWNPQLVAAASAITLGAYPRLSAREGGERLDQGRAAIATLYDQPVSTILATLERNDALGVERPFVCAKAALRMDERAAVDAQSGRELFEHGRGQVGP